MSSVAQLQNERNKLFEQLNVLGGHYQSNLTEKTRLVSAISEASNYLSRKDEMSKALTLLFNRSQQDGVKLYEELLTKLVHEIMPTNDQCERVVLEQGMKRNRPTLNIKIKTSDGKIRDVSNDKGGSIQNILAIGLRFIYVATTPGRNFIVLDEADAGLSEMHMDDFSRMMDYLSRMTGIQVLYISHHPEKYFVGKGRIHYLKRVNGKIISSIASDYDIEKSQKNDIDNEYVTDFSEIYIRNIRLINCGQHENTNLELSPFVNYIVGGNDIGKSTIIKLIKAVAFNKCNSSYIRDNTNELKVQFGLEEETTFEYSYKSKGSKRTNYIVKDKDGNVLNSSDSGDKAPLFINDYFSFHKFKNICPSISEQSSPIFVFDNDKFSEHERAEIIKLSDNASHAQKMIHRHNELITKYTSQKRESEQRLNIIKGRLANLKIMNSIEDHIEKLDELIESETKRTHIIESIVPLAQKIEKNQEDINLIQSALEHDSESFSAIEYLDINAGAYAESIHTTSEDISNIQLAIEATSTPIECQYMPIKEVSVIVENIEATSRQIALIDSLSDLKEIDTPEIKSTQEIKGIASKLIELESQVKVISDVVSLPELATPKTMPLNDIRNFGAKISGLQKEIHGINQDIHQCNTREAELNSMFEQSLSHFATCPLCKQNLNH